VKALVPFALVPTLAACGARTALETGPGVDAGVRDASSQDAGPSVDASPSADATPPPGARYGLVSGSGTLAGLSGPDVAQVVFFPQQGLPPACALVGARGTCAVVTCPSAQSLPASMNAGTVVAAVGTASSPIPYSGSSPTGTYQGANLDAIFTTGDTMRFHGPGGPDVPPFDVAATGPDLVQLDPPWFTTEVTIDTTRDLPVSWGPAPNGGDAVFSVGDFSVGDTAAHELVCFFDATAGSAVVPQADLAALKALVAGAQTDAEFFVAARVATSVAGWQIQASAVVWAGATVSQYGAVILQ